MIASVIVTHRPDSVACSLPVAGAVDDDALVGGDRCDRDDGDGERQGGAPDDDAHETSLLIRSAPAEGAPGLQEAALRSVPPSWDRCPESRPDSGPACRSQVALVNVSVVAPAVSFSSPASVISYVVVAWSAGEEGRLERALGALAGHPRRRERTEREVGAVDRVGAAERVAAGVTGDGSVAGERDGRADVGEHLAGQVAKDPFRPDKVGVRQRGRGRRSGAGRSTARHRPRTGWTAAVHAAATSAEHGDQRHQCQRFFASSESSPSGARVAERRALVTACREFRRIG